MFETKVVPRAISYKMNYKYVILDPIVHKISSIENGYISIIYDFTCIFELIPVKYILSKCNSMK